MMKRGEYLCWHVSYHIISFGRFFLYLRAFLIYDMISISTLPQESIDYDTLQATLPQPVLPQGGH